MSGQEQIRRRDDDEPADDAPVPAAPSSAERDQAVDDLLDEIDDVLEHNAEQFVRGFVQKGGE